MLEEQLVEEQETESCSGDITQLLDQWNRGEAKALDGLMNRVYHELKVMARSLFVAECGNRTLTPTALINEVFLRFVGTDRFQAHNRSQFFWFAGRLMRRILVDHARLKLANKRGSGGLVLCLDQVAEITPTREMDPATLLALDDCLTVLKKVDPRQSQIVEMRFFAGFGLSEIAGLLHISPTTVKREWRMARAWLAVRLGPMGG